MDELIYLDNAATTPLDPQVLEAMMPYLTDRFANASSTTHRVGRIAAEGVERARKQLATLIGASPKEITFTSGATEAINMALKGIYRHYQSKGKHILTCQTEHKAVLDTCKYLEKQGAEVTYLPVNPDGSVSLAALDAAIRPDTVLIAMMYANNETGVLHPVGEIARIATKNDILFFCDATQALGKVEVDVTQTPIDMLCLSAHKFHGPKGVGALYTRRKRKPIQTGALLHGGSQEQNLRAGTLNVPAIVGMGAAAVIARDALGKHHAYMNALRNQLEHGLSVIAETQTNGNITSRLPNISNITFRHLRAQEIMVALPHLAIASGSACVSGDREPSHVLLAMGLKPEEAHASLRFSLSRYTTSDEIMTACKQITEAINTLRQKSPVWQLFQAGLLD